jgi:cell division protein FtsI/penicillin-binding protein 2
LTSWREVQRKRRSPAVGGRLGFILSLVAVASASAVLSVLLSPPTVPATAAVQTSESPADVVAAVGAPPPELDEPGPERDVALPAGARFEYTFDEDLDRRVHTVLDRGRVQLGHVIVTDPSTGRILAHASTDPKRFPATKAYPMASLIKVVTAAAALDADPAVASRPCRYIGNPWRLSRSQVNPPKRGNEISLTKALAISNNQCFAQLAVHTVGEASMLDAIERFGLLEAPAPGYEAGRADAGSDIYGLGKLGCGLAGCRITPLHAAQLAGVIADGMLREPQWISRAVAADGRVLALPPLRPPRQVLTPELAARLRDMLVETTQRGTARSAFRDRRGRPLLGSVEVAGKTGSLSGRDPDGRYEWFMGTAPADDPTIGLAVVVVQGPRWWRSASGIAADVMKEVFCPDGRCNPEFGRRWGRPGHETADAGDSHG